MWLNRMLIITVLGFGLLFESFSCAPIGKDVMEDTVDAGEGDEEGEPSMGTAEPADESGESTGPLFEGDIAGIDPESVGTDEAGLQHNGVLAEEARWKNATIPYVISPHFDSAAVTLIHSVMDNFFDNTCVTFRPRSEEPDYIYIMPGLTCYSNVGKTGNQQKISLHTSCQKFGIIAHELLHAVGFYHEQARSDRNTYVEINWDNIAKGMEENFKSYTNVEISAFGQEYDFDSVLHYGKFDFAMKKDVWTIQPRTPWQDKEIGQRRHLSPIDVRKVNQMYQCAEAKRRVCGHLFSDPGYRGSLTVIHNWTLETYFKTRPRVYGSAVMLAGCKVSLYTEGDPTGVSFTAPASYETFQEKHRTRVTKLTCECE